METQVCHVRVQSLGKPFQLKYLLSVSEKQWQAMGFDAGTTAHPMPTGTTILIRLFLILKDDEIIAWGKKLLNM